MLAYWETVQPHFTGGDTVALVEESRVRSWSDLRRVLTEPMLPIITKFFRPTSNLSYSLDHALWGFDARGFHATNVVLHGAVCAALVAWVARFSRALLAAAIAGLLFALHPVLMEVVPTPTRRQDMLGALFLTCAILWLPSPVRRGAWTAWLPAWIAGVLAFGAKESAVLLPAIVFVWLWRVDPLPVTPEQPLRARRAAWFGAIPFALGAAAFLVWRSIVLGGAGGNEDSWNWTKRSIANALENVLEFSADLAYPLRAWTHPYLGLADRALAGACVIALAWFAWRWWTRETGRERTWAARVFLLCLIGTAAIPLASFALREALESSARPGRGPIEAQVWRGFDALRFAATLALLASTAWLALAHARSRLSEQLAGAGAKTCIGLWVAGYLGLFVVVQRYHAWNAYMPAVPFCALTGLAFAEAWRRRHPAAGVLGTLMVASLCFSPIVRGHAAWLDSGRFNSMLLDEVARIAREVPANRKLEYVDLPNLNLNWQKHGPRPDSVFTANEASLRSWTRLTAPEKGLRVDLISQKPLLGPVDRVTLRWTEIDSERIRVQP